MARMKALKTFRVSGTTTTVRPGDEFEAKNTAAYERRGLAVPVGSVQEAPAADAPRTANKAADAGPLPSRGGETGAERPAPLLSPQVRRPGRPRRSREDDAD